MERLLSAVLLWLSCLVATAAVPAPDVLENTKPYDSRGTVLPLDTEVIGHDGVSQSLRQWMPEDKPVVLTFNYMGCAMLCSLQQEGLSRTLRGLELKSGESFSVVSVSIDHEETPEMAERASARLSDQISGKWTVVTASETSIAALTKAAGFRFEYVKASDQFAHPAVTYVLTPEGKVSQYFAGLDTAPRDMKLALIEASQGRIGSFIDQVTLACLQYDLSANAYVAKGVMRTGGLTILAGLGLFLGLLWRREWIGRS
jgi:protein SCO1/2